MNYYIGDLHLFNRNQTDEGRNYDGRPFATVEEMNQYILERWNAKINNGDTVYILGDMAMRGKNNAILALVAQLKGKKILFRGNHDDLSDYRYQRLFEEITDYREIADSFDGKTYNLYLLELRDLLKYTMQDQYDNIGWWLYEAPDAGYTVSWEEAGKEVSVDLTEAGALYVKKSGCEFLIYKQNDDNLNRNQRKIEYNKTNTQK